MNINFENLKLEFKEYLEKLGKISKLDDKDEFGSVSIFQYGDEFKEFIDEKYGMDLDSDAMNLSEIADTKIKDGKFVIPEDGLSEESNLMLELLNGLFEDEEFAKSIDCNEDGKLDNDEIEGFISFTSEMDDEEKDISFDDVSKGIDGVKSGKYEAAVEEIAKEDKQTQASGGTRSGGGGGGGGNSGTNNTNIQNNNNKESTTKSYDKMNKEELEAEYTQQQANISNQSQNLNSTIAQNDAAIAQAKEEYDKAIGEDNIDPKLLESRNQNLTAITETDNAISKLNTEINNLDTQISSCNSALSLIEGNIASLNAALATLSSAPEDDEEAQQQVEQKRQAIAQELASLEQEKATTTQKLQELEAQRQTAQTSLDENTTKLGELETAKTSIEEQILQTCNENTKATLENYNKTREAADVALKNAQDVLKAEKDKLGEIKTHLSKSNDKNIMDKFGYSEKGDIFIPYEGYSEVEDIEKVNNMDYKVLLANGADTDKELPVIVFLHGANGSKNALQNQALNADRLAADGVSTAFNGYIICPTMSGNCETAAQNIDEILNSFSKNHKIDKDNIVLVGYSNGGTYAAGIANSNTFNDGSGYEFSKVALLTGYTNQKTSFNIPVGVWIDGSSRNLKNTIEIDESKGDKFVDWTKKSHYDMEDDGFREDANGDGKADMIQWLFDDE